MEDTLPVTNPGFMLGTTYSFISITITELTARSIMWAQLGVAHFSTQMQFFYYIIIFVLSNLIWLVVTNQITHYQIAIHYQSGYASLEPK